MTEKTPPHGHDNFSRRFRIRRERYRLPVIWAVLFAACALLATSEIVWLWHAWPVRQVLEGEQLEVRSST